MNYEQFCAAWYEALTEAGMWSYLAPPTETVDLGGMSRTYQAYIHLGRSQEVKPFQVPVVSRRRVIARVDPG